MNALQATQAAKIHQQMARERMWPGTVTYLGTDYVAAVTRGKADVQDLEGNQRQVDTLSASVRKDLMSAQPSSTGVIGSGGVDYRIDSVGGLNAIDVAWEIRALRD